MWIGVKLNPDTLIICESSLTVGSDPANPSTAPSPSQPEVVPDASPEEKPNKPKTPYQPGPGKDSKPKGLAEKKKIK